MDTCYRMITLRGLLIGVVLHVCSTVTEAQVGAALGIWPDLFQPTAQVGVPYAYNNFVGQYQFSPYTWSITYPPTTVQLNDANQSVFAQFRLATGAQAGLPPGITFSINSSTGDPQLSGTPTAGGIYIISLQLSNRQKATVNVLVND